MKALFLLSLSLLAVIATAEDVAFFYFVQQWPGSYCFKKGECCYSETRKPNFFTIRGLWPARRDDSIISDCTHPDSPFDFNKLGGLDRDFEMEHKWPSLKCASSDVLKLWGDAWDKHGTCAGFQDQFSYFSAALNLYDRAHILRALEDNGIFPDGRKYLLTTITAAIVESFRVIPDIECNKNEESEIQLFRIYLCVDRFGEQYINCPGDRKVSCGTPAEIAQVKFPKF